MLHEIGTQFNNHYRSFSPEEDDFVLCFSENQILYAQRDGCLCYPTVKETERDAVSHYLFSVDGSRFFLGDSLPFSAYAYHDISTLRSFPGQASAFAGVTGWHLFQWYRDHRFCGRCGKPMRHSETERAMACECGNLCYPQICPAVIVAIISKGRICLTKYNRPNARWALVAGYTEIGETVEDAVRREVMEETGLRVANLRYYKSQPWGLTGSLLSGYFCEAEGDDTIRIDNVELKEGRWFAPEEIDFENDGVSLTREMIDVFRRGMNF